MTKTFDPSAGEKSIAPTVPTQTKAATRAEQLEPDTAKEKNVVEPVLTRKKEPKPKTESKHIDAKSLPEKTREQEDTHDIAQNTGENLDRQNQLDTEQEKNRKIELMEQVHSQFRVAGTKFHFKDKPDTIAFKDKGERMVSALNDDRVAKAMAVMADAKGWKTIKVSGHPEFQRAVWLEAESRGIKVRGFKPTEQDLKVLEDKRERAMHNTVEHDQGHAQERKAAGRSNLSEQDHQGPTAAVRAYAGRFLDHGAANFNFDPKEKRNYFVKMSTETGEKTVWGVDLKRAMNESQVKTGDEVKLEFKGMKQVTVEALKRDQSGNVIGSEEIVTNRNTWEVQKSEKAKVVEAVAAAFINAKVSNPAQREALKAAVGERIAQRDRANKVPVVPVFDKAAPAPARQERLLPVVERKLERTR